MPFVIADSRLRRTLSLANYLRVRVKLLVARLNR